MGRKTVAERAAEYLREHGHDQGAEAIALYELARKIGASPQGLRKAISQTSTIRIWQEVWIEVSDD